MNKLTKSELIEKLKPLRNPSNARQYNVAVMDIINIIQDTKIIPDPVPEVDTELEEAKKLVGTWVKFKSLNQAFKVTNVHREPKCNNVIVVSNGDELTPRLKSVEPFPLPTAAPIDQDLELEEAKKRFSVGSWYHSLSFHVAYKVTEVKRRSDHKAKPIFVCSADGYECDVKFCTPATLPTAAPKWRCMKTDVENTLMTRLVCLNDTYHTGFYDIAKETWCVDNQYIDLSCYYSHLWLEIPRGE